MAAGHELNLEEFSASARRRLPRLVFDYIEGGVDGESCLARNRDAFGRYHLLPRYLVDVSRRSQAVTVLDAIPGVDRRGAEPLVAEWGIEMARFGTAA